MRLSLMFRNSTHTEWSTVNTARVGVSLRDVIDAMTIRGYRLVRVYRYA